MGIIIDQVRIAVFKARQAQQAADAASARGNTAEAARHAQNAAGWRRAAIRAQANLTATTITENTPSAGNT
jgi:hypothetical protein